MYNRLMKFVEDFNFLYDFQLSLKVAKSCFIVFKSVKQSDLEVNICINNKCLSCVSQVKFLGTIIDDGLAWRPHIDYICKKLSKAISFMYSIKPYVTQEILCGLYYSLVYPYLTYCNVIWRNTFKAHLKPIISLQIKAVRCLNFRNHNDFSNDAPMLELELNFLIRISISLASLCTNYIMALYQMYLMIIFHVIVLFMNITHVWEKVSLYKKLEMIMENDHCGAMLVC